MIDFSKEANRECKGGNCEDCQCSCSLTIGNSKKKDRTEFQSLVKHLENLCWIFFILALIFSSNTYLIWALLIAAIVFGEFD